MLGRKPCGAKPSSKHWRLAAPAFAGRSARRYLSQFMSVVRNIEIRHAGAADAAAIAEVHLRSHRETYVALVGEKNYWPADPMERLHQWQGLLAGEGVVFVAVEKGELEQSFGPAHGWTLG